jgi:hypothetical protein
MPNRGDVGECLLYLAMGSVGGVWDADFAWIAVIGIRDAFHNAGPPKDASISKNCPPASIHASTA